MSLDVLLMTRFLMAESHETSCLTNDAKKEHKLTHFPLAVNKETRCFLAVMK